MDVRRFGPQYRSPSYTLKRTQGGLRDLLRHPLPQRGAPGGTAAQGVVELRVARRARRGVRGEVGVGAGQLVRVQRGRRGGRSRPAPRGWAGHHWSPAIGAEHRACRERAALFDESSFSKMEVSGPGAALFLESLCDNHVAREVGRITYTQMLNARGGIECDFTVTRVAAERLPDRHRHRVRPARPRLDRQARAARRQRDDHRHHVALGVLRAVGPARPRRPRAAHARPARLPVHVDARDRRRRRPGPRAARHVRRRARAGSCTRRPSTAPRCGARSGPPGEPHGLVAGGYRAIDSLRLEKGYRVWGADITPDQTPLRGGARVLRARGAERLPRRATRSTPSRSAASSASSSTTRARSAWATSPSRSGGEVIGRVTSGGYGYTLDASIAYAYVPTAHAGPDTQVDVDVFGTWVGARIAPRAVVRPGVRARQGTPDRRIAHPYHRMNHGCKR